MKKIKHAENKEQAIENILNELDEHFSKVQVIELLEKYFREDEKKSLDENFSRGKDFPCKGRFDYYSEPLQATDNSKILKALGKMKKFY